MRCYKSRVLVDPEVNLHLVGTEFIGQAMSRSQTESNRNTAFAVLKAHPGVKHTTLVGLIAEKGITRAEARDIVDRWDDDLAVKVKTGLKNAKSYWWKGGTDEPRE